MRTRYSHTLQGRVLTWLFNTMVKLARSVSTLVQVTTLGPLVVQPLLLDGEVTI